MIIAKKLREENISEYLIYMWQVEDLLRAFSLDIDKVKANYLVRFTDWNDQQQAEAAQWYEDLINMMRSEGIAQRGHLRICHNVIINLTDLHQSLMQSQKFPYYRAAYQEALPLIVELRSHQPDADEHPELESCFDLLYGMMILRMQQRPVSDDTQQAAKKISTFLGMLTDYYHKNQKEPLEF